jgi:O-methyltransferase
MDALASDLQTPVAALRDRYLDLLERALMHTLYEGVDALQPPPGASEFWDVATDDEKRLALDPERTRREGRDWPAFGQTMVGAARLHSVRRCVETLVAEEVPGDLIEAGVWRGGVGILMRGVLEAWGDETRDVWLADSFQGLPPPDPQRFPADRAARMHERPELAVSAEQVRAHFRRYGLLDERVRLVEGWFRDTLPRLRGHAWALVRLDADMYESTKLALDNLYGDLSPGGFLVVDDFAIAACKAAVEDFRRERGIEEEIERIDWTGVLWRKSR